MTTEAQTTEVQPASPDPAPVDPYVAVTNGVDDLSAAYMAYAAKQTDSAAAVAAVGAAQDRLTIARSTSATAQAAEAVAGSGLNTTIDALIETLRGLRI